MPLLLVMMLAFALGELRLGRRGARAVAVGLAILVAGQTCLGFEWSSFHRAQYVATVPWGELPHREPMFCGRDGRSWFAWFRALRKREPGACRYVFSQAELYEARWNSDIVGSLWSELPEHLLLTEPRRVPHWDASRWRYPVRAMTVADATEKALLSGCVWFSDDTRRVLEVPP